MEMLLDIARTPRWLSSGRALVSFFFFLKNANELKIHRPFPSECRGILGKENGDGLLHGSPTHDLCPEEGKNTLRDTAPERPPTPFSLLLSRW